MKSMQIDIEKLLDSLNAFYQDYSGHDLMAAALCWFNFQPFSPEPASHLRDLFCRIPKAIKCPQGQSDILKYCNKGDYV